MRLCKAPQESTYLTSNLGQRIMSQAGVQNSIRDLISNLIRVPFAYTLRGEEKVSLLCSVDIAIWDCDSHVD